MAQTYGFTIEDPSKVVEVNTLKLQQGFIQFLQLIYIYKDEIVEACVARLGKSYAECDDSTSQLLVENEEEGGHIDFECNIESDPLKRIFVSYSQVFEPDFSLGKRQSRK